MRRLKRPKALPTTLMPGDTISGAIKKYNLYNPDRDELQELLQTFKDINGSINFKPGMRVLVPILERNESEVFK